MDVKYPHEIFDLTDEEVEKAKALGRTFVELHPSEAEQLQEMSPIERRAWLDKKKLTKPKPDRAKRARKRKLAKQARATHRRRA